MFEELFKSTEYNPSYYDNLIEKLNVGAVVTIENNKVSPAENLFRSDCRTKEELDFALYELFIKFIEPNHNYLIWGLNEQYTRNPLKEFNSMECYYDGFIFSLVKNEYLDLLKYYCPARILSLAYHYLVFEGDGKLEIIIS